MEKALRRICHILMLMGGAGVVLMMLNVTLDVVLKAFWNTPIQGTLEISSYYYMVAIVMLPMALVELDDEHVVVDLVYNRLPGWVQRIVLVIACAAAVAILAVMTWRTGQDAIRAWRVGEVVMGSREVIVWPARVMLPIGFGLSTVAASLRMVMALLGKPMTRAIHEATA